jgi:hypothetical protein
MHQKVLEVRNDGQLIVMPRRHQDDRQLFYEDDQHILRSKLNDNAIDVPGGRFTPGHTPGHTPGYIPGQAHTWVHTWAHTWAHTLGHTFGHTWAHIWVHTWVNTRVHT